MRVGGHIRPYVAGILAAMRLVDAALIALSWYVAFLLTPYSWIDSFIPVICISVIVYGLAAERGGLYRSWRGRRLIAEAGVIVRAWSLVCFSSLLILYATKSSAVYSRQLVLSWFVLAPLGLIGLRVALRAALEWMRERGYNVRRVALVGAGGVGRELARRINAAPWSGLKLEACYADDVPRGESLFEEFELSVKGQVSDLLVDNRLNLYDVIYIALPFCEQEDIQALVANLADSTSSVYVVPDYFVSDLLVNEFVGFDGIPAISVYESPFHGSAGWVKRAEDLALSCLILPLIMVPVIVIAALIKLNSKGPVIYRQRRYGLNGEEIVVWKFRTMKVCDDSGAFKQATRNDHRVTPLGRFLRRTSLDELPQFFNVLQGRMSVVGPRPHPVLLNEQFRHLIPGYMLRHKLKPGITGWAQVNGWRGETDTLEKMEKRIQYDLDYFRRWSIWFDLRIVYLTIIREIFGSRKAF